MSHETAMDPAVHHVTVVGAGGNIGSHLVSHLARIPGIRRITLLDPDYYEGKNLLSQNIAPREVNKAKALVQARHLRAYRHLHVEARVQRVEDMPLGRLRCSVIAACLDSRAARQYVNQAAWRLGIPWVDAAVDGPELLARVNVYLPGAEGASCLECSWGPAHYASLEQVYPCGGSGQGVAATNAPSALGALAASLQAIEVEKLLAGQHELAAVSRQVMINARYHRHVVTRLPRNAQCLFDHETWRIHALAIRPEDLTLGDVFSLPLLPSSSAARGTSLHVEGSAFLRTLRCSEGCGNVEIPPLRLSRRLRPREKTCRRCGGELVASGIDLLHEIVREDLSARDRQRSMAALGFSKGDVFAVSSPDGNTTHCEFACAPARFSFRARCVSPGDRNPWRRRAFVTFAMTAFRTKIPCSNQANERRDR